MPVSRFERDYTVHGFHLKVHGGDPSVDADLAVMLAHLRVAHSPTVSVDPDLSLEVRIEAPLTEVPPGAEFVAEADRGIDVWQAGKHLYLHREAMLVQLDPASGRGTLWLPPDARDGHAGQRAALFDAVTLSLLIFLRHRGLYMVHAAGLVHEAAGYLLIGKSHSGKSTLAFSLVRQGWGYLSDDMILLRLEDERVEALSLGRDARLTAESIRLFPELNGPQMTRPGDSDKWHIDVEALYPDQGALRCVPRVLIFPEIVPQAESRLLPLGRTPALLRLIDQSTLVSPNADLAAKQLDVLKRLVGQAPAYRLLGGHDLGRDPSLFSALLARFPAALHAARC